jgi:hypothetical protein
MTRLMSQIDPADIRSYDVYEDPNGSIVYLLLTGRIGCHNDHCPAMLPPAQTFEQRVIASERLTIDIRCSGGWPVNSHGWLRWG